MKKFKILNIPFLLCIFLFPLPKPEYPKQVYVLCYHTFIGNVSYIDFSKKELQDHIFYLKNSGFKFISLTDFVTENFEGTKNILITIDDGNNSVYDAYKMILKPLNINPVIAIFPSRLEKDPYRSLSIKQIIELKKDGCDIVVHGYKHRPITNATISNPLYIYEEFYLSKAILDLILNNQCYVYVYPYGIYTEYCFGLLKHYGYTYAFTLGDKPVTFPIKEKYAIPRIMLTRKNVWKVLPKSFHI